ncbi:SAF domain-containing protein [Leekyejoonella antrihumi]|uniref:SAF domain-containing protein n=1 Tax=Leekyejoonella antrihumi TaxID=1660198 RepID=A0A563DYR5_9MICO|nr:SAF domain-containing protein [Leekyejoonella antrihumi]TWP35112.1 hypothetical protein FGL98_15295 [Leekyejoonella antrihumi]
MAEPRLRTDDRELPRPAAMRLQRPSWRDGRLVIGVLLVLVAMLAGAATLRHFDSSVERLAATHALVPGQHIGKGDVKVVKVRIPGSNGRYLSGASALPHGVVLRPVQPGELVPRSAVGVANQLDHKSVALPVDISQSSDLVVGSIVDVWVSRKQQGTTGVADFEKPERLIERTTVARVPDADRSGLSVSTGDVSVHVLVPDGKVALVLAAVNGGAKVNLVPAPGSPLQGSHR